MKHVGGLNDMVVDAQGRAYVGNFGFDLMGGADIAPSWLLRVDPDGRVTRVAEDLWFANGSVITDEVPPDALAIARGRQENKRGRAPAMREKLQGKRR